jgi:hypothetical protein
MISSEVQRTLVKSPPELWAEISDPASLARHLGEFGEIRITRVDPEQRVEWTAGDTSGSVVIKPSGWGTKVKLTVKRELADGDAIAELPAEDDLEQADDANAGADAEADVGAAGTVDAEVDAEGAGTVDAIVDPQVTQAVDADLDAEGAEAAGAEELETDDPTFSLDHELESDSVPEAMEEHAFTEQHDAEEPDAAPATPRRRGFFARLFGRRHAQDVEPLAEPATVEPPDSEELATARPRYNALSVWASQAAGDDDEDFDEPADDVQPPPLEAEAWPAADTPVAIDAANPADAQPSEAEIAENAAASDLAAELQAAEDVAVEQVTAVLTGVLDRLGAAHHRPFSRA